MKQIFHNKIFYFYLMSCAISWPFMIWSQFFSDSWHAIPIPHPIKTSLFMWGPGLAALIMWRLADANRTLKRYRIFTGGKIVNLLIYCAPMVLFVTLFYGTLETNQILFFLTIYNVVGFFNTCGEELGWRGYLQPNLDNISFVKRFILLGILWECWHLPMRIGAILNGANPLFIGLLALGTIVITFIIGLYVERTRSVGIAISLHAAFNSAMSLPAMSKISQQEFIPFYILIFAFYIAVYFIWNKISKTRSAVPT